MPYTIGQQTTLNGAISATDQSIVLTSGTGFSVGDYVLISAETTNTSEIVYVQAKSTNTLTVLRQAQSEGWAPRASAHADTAPVSRLVPAAGNPVPAGQQLTGNPLTLNASTIYAGNLPTADPHVATQLYTSAGAVKVSAG